MRAAVLDFDGVIARSMELHAEAYRQVLKPYHVTATDRDVFLLEGARSETLIRELLQRSGHPAAEDEVRRLAEEKQRIFAGLGPAPLYPGAERMVLGIREAVDRLGLVTGTRRENLERLIPGLLSRFDAVLAQDSYRRDKPDPEPYLNAAKALGAAPRDCAALENAVRGVESAKGAGFDHVVGLTTTLREAELRKAGADYVASSHDDALKAIRGWALSGAGRRVP